MYVGDSGLRLLARSVGSAAVLVTYVNASTNFSSQRGKEVQFIVSTRTRPAQTHLRLHQLYVPRT